MPACPLKARLACKNEGTLKEGKIFQKTITAAGIAFGAGVGSANGSEVAAASAGADPSALIFGIRHKF
jgi:hypothetical protein